MFQEFAVTVSAAIAVSALVSLTLTPTMCAYLLKPSSEALLCADGHVVQTLHAGDRITVRRADEQGVDAVTLAERRRPRRGAGCPGARAAGTV